jgi:uncharacterized protein YbaR (Trm112 family)
MSEVLTSNIVVVLCPECKTNQPGVVGDENKCINIKCKKSFTPAERVPVMVWPDLEKE